MDGNRLGARVGEMKGRGAGRSLCKSFVVA